MTKIILIGSAAIFKNIEGFVPNDYDILIWTDASKYCTKWRRVGLSGIDVLEMKSDMSKQEIIESQVTKTAPEMCFGLFLCAEFAELIGLTIDDLTNIYPFFCARFNKKHKYFDTVYNAYIANNGFTMTDEQLQEAYAIYRSGHV